MASLIVITRENFQTEVLKSVIPVFIYCGMSNFPGDPMPIFQRFADEFAGKIKFCFLDLHKNTIPIKLPIGEGVPLFTVFMRGEQVIAHGLGSRMPLTYEKLLPLVNTFKMNGPIKHF